MYYRFIIKRDQQTNQDAPDYINGPTAKQAAYKAFEKYGNRVFPNGYNGALLYNIKGKEKSIAKGIRL